MTIILAILLKPCHILVVALSYCPAMQKATPHPKKFSPGLAIAVEHGPSDALHIGALLP
jgi:hypothetical protein